jgi:C-terminal processing protease CtpA/Prc
VRKPQRPPAAIALAALALLACAGRSPAGAATLTLPGQRGGAWPGGVGAVLRYAASARRLTVHEAPADGAAARAGLRAGDEVLAIDGATVAELPQDAVVARLRGDVGTVVTLRIRRDGVERDVPVERAPYRRPERD